MPDLEGRLRRDLDQLAAGLHVESRPPDMLLTRVRRRRQRKAAAATVLVAACLLALVPIVRSGDGRTDVATGPATDLLRFPPTFTGSVVARSDGGTVRFDLRSPGTEQLNTQASEGLEDGRFVTLLPGKSNEWALVDPAGGPPLPLGQDVKSVKLLPDGRLVMLAGQNGRIVLRKLDPRSGAIQDRQVPSVLKRPVAVAVGPGGAVAILGIKESGYEPSDLLVIRPDGQERHEVVEAPKEKPNRVGPVAGGTEMLAGGYEWGPLELSWGASGLIAISPRTPQPRSTASYNGRPAPELDNLHPGWTQVIAPDTGHLVAFFDGWQGLAWSSDGRGLLAGRRDGELQSALVVWWGPGLKNRFDLGRTAIPVVPTYWIP